MKNTCDDEALYADCRVWISWCNIKKRIFNSSGGGQTKFRVAGEFHNFVELNREKKEGGMVNV
jgi:hypothetical protein